MTALEHRVPPPVLALIVGILMGLGGAAGAAPPIPWALRIAGGAAALLVAATFGGTAFRAFARARTTIDPVNVDRASALVTDGIYSVSRNPMYVGLTALLVALALMLSNWWLLAGPAFFVAFMTRFQIMPEERAMTARFGPAFLSYRRQVRRWL